VHFGTGKSTLIDTVEIIWPDGKVSRMLNQQTNQVILVEQDQATERTFDFSFGKNSVSLANPLFISWSSFHSIEFCHKENPFDDFTVDPLLPYRFSRNGPYMATGDLNHDGLDDIWIGGPAKIPGMLFFQQKGGGFIGKEMPDKGFEDQEGLFFDADLDGDLDLYVVSGGNEYNPHTAAYQDRLYINDGKGNLTRRKSSVPIEYASGKCVKAADFDKDGDLDLFVGGRMVPNHYPQVPESFLFVNDGHGNFVNGTKQLAPGLQYTGMVTDVVWSDIDRDGWMDLVLVGEYMSIIVFNNLKGILVEAERSDQTGLWTCIEAGDFDHDGDEDFVLGNWGLNNGMGVSEKTPLSVYAISSEKKIFPVTTVYNSGTEYTLAGYDQLTPVFPALSKKFRNFDAFSHAEFPDIFDKDKIHLKLSVNYLNSVFLENINGKLGKLEPLPLPAQVAPLSDFWIDDLNGDTHLDILAIGNSYNPDYIVGQQDALSGLLLTGDGKGGFQALSALQSGIQLQGDMKSIVSLKISGEQVWLIGTNSSSIQGFRYAQSLKK
jgi:hypothetical protein